MISLQLTHFQSLISLRMNHIIFRNQQNIELKSYDTCLPCLCDIITITFPLKICWVWPLIYIYANKFFVVHKYDIFLFNIFLKDVIYYQWFLVLNALWVESHFQSSLSVMTLWICFRTEYNSRCQGIPSNNFFPPSPWVLQLCYFCQCRLADEVALELLKYLDSYMNFRNTLLPCTLHTWDDTYRWHI